MREGWKCPVCGKGVSPDEKSCDHSGTLAGWPMSQPMQPVTQPAPTVAPPHWPTVIISEGQPLIVPHGPSRTYGCIKSDRNENYWQ